MQVHNDFSKLHQIKNPVVTTGTFDGVHLGHKVIINRLNRLAREINGESVLITFHPHPRRVLYPESKGNGLKLINTQREKVFLLEQTGLDHLVVINFTKEFAATTSEEFLEEILLRQLGAKRIIVGFNHYFGHNREGDFQYLFEKAKTHDFEAEEIPEQDLENETVSSTIIRKALSEGKIQRANAYLDHFFTCIGPLKEGHPVCREIGFPSYTLEIEEDVKLIPPEGVYAVSMRTGEERYKGMLNIKIYDHQHTPSVQLHLFNYNNPSGLLGKLITVFFHKRMRDELSITERSSLKKQLERDKEQIEQLIY